MPLTRKNTLAGHTSRVRCPLGEAVPSNVQRTKKSDASEAPPEFAIYGNSLRTGTPAANRTNAQERSAEDRKGGGFRNQGPATADQRQ